MYEQKLPKVYSKELIDLLFYELYTKIIYIEKCFPSDLKGAYELGARLSQ